MRAKFGFIVDAREGKKQKKVIKLVLGSCDVMCDKLFSLSCRRLRQLRQLIRQKSLHYPRKNCGKDQNDFPERYAEFSLTSSPINVKLLMKNTVIMSYGMMKFTLFKVLRVDCFFDGTFPLESPRILRESP